MMTERAKFPVRDAVTFAATALFACAPLAAAAQPSDSNTPRDVVASDRSAASGGARETDEPIHEMMLENPFNTFVLFDQLEAQNTSGDATSTWELTAWAGRNFNRLWIRSEGERQSGNTDSSELELLWGRSIAPWWDLVVGVREESRPSPSQSWAAFGIQGLAPYRFELNTTLYAGEGGQTAARFEAEHELLITQRLILQPLVELNWSGQADAAREIGSGFSSAEIALRLRYEFRREVAPYIGLVREKKFGSTADFARAAGRDADDSRLVAGIRLWF